MDIPLFVYGTLCDAELRRAVMGRTLPAEAFPATAPGFRIVRYPGRPYPALMPAADARADGLVLTGLANPELERLDAYEGDEYRRELIRVTGTNGPFEAFTYLPTLPVPADAPLWHLDDWRARHKASALAGLRRSAPDQKRREGPLSP